MLVKGWTACNLFNLILSSTGFYLFVLTEKQINITMILNKNMFGLLENKNFNTSGLLLSINNTAKVNYFPFEKSQSLQRYISAMQAFSSSYTTFVGPALSFLEPNARRERLLREVATFQRMGYLSFQADQCLPEIKGHTCTKYKNDVIYAIRSTVKYFYFATVTIITSNHPCEAEFSKTLSTTLSNIQNVLHIHRDELVDSKYYLIDTEPLNASQIIQILYKVKARSTNLIVLAVEDPIVELIFRIASSFMMLDYHNVWLTIDFKLPIALKFTPSQFINMKFEPNAQNISWNTDVIRSLVKNVVPILNASDTEQLQSLRLKDTLATNLFSVMHKQKTFTCNNHINQDVTYPILFRQPDGHWQRLFTYSNGYGMRLDSTNTEFMRLFQPTLHGIHLNVVAILDPPFTTAIPQYYSKSSKKPCDHGTVCKTPHNTTRNGTEWKLSCCVGHSMELLRLLTKDLHFYPQVYIVEDGYYGSLRNGTWEGLVGDVLKGKADFAIAGLTANEQRSAVVDFTEPFIRVDLGILTSSKQPALKFLNFNFLTYLSETLLWLILLCFIIGTILVYVFENEQMVLARIFDPNLRPPVYPWREGFSYFSGLSFQRDLGGKNPRRCGARVTAIVFAFAMVIIMTTYTAVLTASKVKQEERYPFLGFKDTRIQQPTNDFKYATVSRTSVETFFQESPNPVHQRMYHFMRQYNTGSTSKGIQNVIDGHIEAFISEYPFLQYYISKQRDCQLKIVGEPVGQASYAIALKKNSIWKYRLSQAILKYKETGAMDELNKKWLTSACSKATNQTVLLESLRLEYFGGVYVLLAVSLGISIVLLGTEHLYFRHHKRVVDPLQEALKSWKEKRGGRRNALQVEDQVRKWSRGAMLTRVAPNQINHSIEDIMEDDEEEGESGYDSSGAKQNTLKDASEC